MLPAALILLLLQGYPLVRLVLISFQDYGLRALFTGATPWIGFANYTAILTIRAVRPSPAAHGRVLRGARGSARSPSACGRADAGQAGQRMRTAVTCA
jgi:ABC-type sugar transport system permease subunit